MDFAFEKTFKKGQQMFGTEKTIENMKNCLKKYITMKYSLNRINKQNIIETIRKDNI